MAYNGIFVKSQPFCQKFCKKLQTFPIYFVLVEELNFILSICVS